MRVVIVEDEHHSSKMLAGMIQKIRPNWKIVKSLTSVKETINWLNSHQHPDLIMMDIQLTDGISFSVFDEIKIESAIIFTTAYDEYAIQAFNVNSIDYLLKPIKEENLLKAIAKFEKISDFIAEGNKAVEHDYNDLLKALKNGKKEYRKRFLINGTTSFFKLDTKDIAYFNTVNRVTFAVTFSGEEHIVDLTIEKLEEQLDPEVFFRANRSQVLHIDTVDKIEAYFGGKLIIHLIPPFKSSMTVSRLKASEFKKWIDK